MSEWVGNVMALAQLVNKFPVLDAAAHDVTQWIQFHLVFFLHFACCFECVRIIKWKIYFFHFNLQLNTPGSWFINKTVILFLLAFCQSIRIVIEFVFFCFCLRLSMWPWNGMHLVAFNFIQNSDTSECQIDAIFINKLIEQQCMHLKTKINRFSVKTFHLINWIIRIRMLLLTTTWPL